MDIEAAVGEIRVGGKVFTFELPKHLKQALIDHGDEDNEPFVSEDLIYKLRELVPYKHRPPTDRQIKYATSISRYLGIELSPEVFIETKACSDFIDEYAGEYQVTRQLERENREAKKVLARKLARIGRILPARDALNNGASVEEVAAMFKVKPPTIEKYCAEIADFEANLSESNAERAWYLVRLSQEGFDLREELGVR